MKANVLAFSTGMLFAAGLALGGMTQPQKVIGFLDVAGAWDASLAFVMAGGLAVAIVAWRLASRMRTPLLGGLFPTFDRTAVDGRLLGGAALFGVGWGISGFCPGPAIVSLGAGMTNALVFVPAMFFGLFLGNIFDARAHGQAQSGRAPERAAGEASCS